MNAAICSAPPASNADILGYTIKDAVAAVSCREPHTLPAEGGEKYRVALIDYGAKRNIARELCRRGCTVTVYPHTVCAEEILGGSYDGVMLSNGPGDPSENTREIAVIGELFGRLPIFGICLGHQLLALSQGRTDGQAQIRTSRRKSACARGRGQPHVYHEPESRLCRRLGHRSRRARELRQRKRRQLRGYGLPAGARLFGTVPPRGMLGTA